MWCKIRRFSTDADGGRRRVQRADGSCRWLPSKASNRYSFPLRPTPVSFGCGGAATGLPVRWPNMPRVYGSRTIVLLLILCPPLDKACIVLGKFSYNPLAPTAQRACDLFRPNGRWRCYVCICVYLVCVMFAGV